MEPQSEHRPQSTIVRDAAALLEARNDLAVYAAVQKPDYILGKHHQIIIDHLHALEAGEFEYLMIFCPPQNGKSSTATELFPAWYLGRHPTEHVVLASYAQPKADEFGDATRAYVESPFHKAIFP